MNKSGIAAVLCTLFLLISFSAAAQPKIYSPLSRLGLGDPVPQAFMHARHMGGLEAAYNDKNFVNPVNPASLGELEATSFEVGLKGTYTELNSNDESATFWSGNMDYLTLAMPLINPINEALEREETDLSMGLLLGVQPFTRVGYDVTSTETDPAVGQIQRQYTGSGGSYQVYAGYGITYKTLSLGLRAAYLFGNLENKRIVTFPDREIYFFDDFEEDINFNGVLWRIGAQYDWVLERNEPIVEGEQGAPRKTLTFGGYYQPEQSFSTESTQLFERKFIFESFPVRDTLNFVDGVEEEGRLPARYSLGVFYEDKGKWSGGLDWRSTDWSAYQNEAKADDLFDTWRIAGGVSIIPDENAISGIFKRSQYRFGVQYGTDSRKFQGEQGRFYKISAGIGFPFVFNRQTSYVNLGFYYGKDGVPDRLDGTQFGLNIGFTLTDNSWFVKKKYK